MTEQEQMDVLVDVKGFPERLKVARQLAGLSQVSIAKKLGVARQTYLDLENGKTEPRFSMLSAMAEVTGKSFAWLTTGQSAFLPLDGDKKSCIPDLRRQVEALLVQILSLEMESGA